MRRLMTILLLLFAFFALPCAALASEPEAVFALVTAEKAALYASQEKGDEPAGEIARGEWVEVLSQSGEWIQVQTEAGQTGYITTGQAHIPQVHYGVVGIVRNPDEMGLLNLRAQPDWDAEVLDVYRSGVPCLLLSLDKGWYRVRVNGLEGYFREEFIRQFYGPSSDTAATVMAPEGSALQLRVGPGRAWESLSSCESGTCVMVLAEGQTWWQVALDGQVGFMNAAFLRKGVHRDLSTASDAEAAAWSVATVHNPSEDQLLNLRETPSRDSRSLGRYPSGTEVYILRQGLEWCKVKLKDAPGVTGFMATEFLNLGILPAVPQLTVTHPESTFVNLRAFPMTTLGIVLLRVPHGEQVDVLIPDDIWMKVRYHDTVGYMQAYYLR